MELQNSRKWDQASSLKTVCAGEQSGKANSSQVTLSVMPHQAGIALENVSEIPAWGTEISKTGTSGGKSHWRQVVYFVRG